jgi:hypothetical protein
LGFTVAKFLLIALSGIAFQYAAEILTTRQDTFCSILHGPLNMNFDGENFDDW